MNTKAINILPIEVQMKTGILKTIANSIYSDPKIKIREAVANSMDNKSAWFIIYLDRPTRTISLFDNGNGITKDRFKEIFKSLGYSMLKNKDSYSNSYFGLGLMSVLELGKKAIIITKPKNENEIIKVEIKSKEIFSNEMEDKPLKDINQITLTESSLSDREIISPLSETEIKELFKSFPYNFTEIILEDIDIDIFDRIISKDFDNELCKILPLKVQKDEPFFNSIKDPEAIDWIKEIINNNKEYCPTIDIYRGISEGEQKLTQLWKYFPDFKQDLEFGKADIIFNISSDNEFMFYYLYSTDDLEEKKKSNTETGFWVRNKNFLVKEADYFQKPGTIKKIIHDPLKNWLFGEIFHRNMTEFLVVTRDEYRWESEKFKIFYEELNKTLCYLNSTLRKAWKISREVIESIVNPFVENNDKKNPFNRSYDTLSEIGIIKDEKDINEILLKLHENRKEELENDDKRIDILIKERKEILLAETEDVKVMIDKNITKEKIYLKQREENNNRIVVRISPHLFDSQKVEFLGKTFNIYYICGNEEHPGVSINNENDKIYINPFNHDVLKFSISFIDVYIAVEIADILSENKNEMKSYLIELLGAKLTKSDVIPMKYFNSLKDELQRIMVE